MRQPIALLALAAVLVVPSACSTTQRARTETAIADVLIPPEQEKQLGIQVHQELERQGVKLSEDPVVVGYVNSVTSRLIPVAAADRKEEWHVHVIDDLKTVNAFATPGGHVYLYTGLLAAANSEAEVAGVLGHEIAHVVARHAARQMVQLYGLQTIAGLALGQNPSQLAQIAATFAANGALLAHSRADETEADEHGVRYTSGAGYDPRGLIGFLEITARQQGKTPRILSWLQTHPYTPDRIAHLEDYIAENHLGGTDQGPERLAPIKQRLGGPPVSER